MTRLKKSPASPGSLLFRIRLILATGWDILLDGLTNYQINGNTNQAAAIALYAILSIIPLFILTILMAGQFFGSDPNIQREIIDGMRGLHPYFSGDLLIQLGRIDEKQHVLGWVGIISLIWFSAMIFGAIQTAFNIIFRAKSYRNYIVSKLLAIAMIPLGWTVGVASVVLTYVTTILAQQPTMFKAEILIIHGFLFRYVIPYLVTVVFFTIVYKIIPPVKVRTRARSGGKRHFFGTHGSGKTVFHLVCVQLHPLQCHLRLPGNGGYPGHLGLLYGPDPAFLCRAHLFLPAQRFDPSGESPAEAR